MKTNYTAIEVCKNEIPGFPAIHGRKAEAHRDFSFNAPMSQDDHDYLLGAGIYRSHGKVVKDGLCENCARPIDEAHELALAENEEFDRERDYWFDRAFARDCGIPF